jgi:hypothetical protein
MTNVNELAPFTIFELLLGQHFCPVRHAESRALAKTVTSLQFGLQLE